MYEPIYLLAQQNLFNNIWLYCHRQINYQTGTGRVYVLDKHLKNGWRRTQR